MLTHKNIKNIFFTLLFLFSANPPSLKAAWSPPMQISAGASSINTGGTPLVIDSYSIALAGWLNGQIGISQTSSSATLFPQSFTWTTPQTIYTNSFLGVFPSFPTMSEDIFGIQTAAFSIIDIMTPSITLEATRRSSNNDIWPPPFSQPLAGIPGASALAIGNMSNLAALLALTTTGAPPFDITLVQLLADSSTWLPPIVFAVDNSMQPAVAAQAINNQGAFLWKINTPSLQLQSIRFVFSTQEASLMPNVPLPPLTTDVISVNLAVDPEGDAVVAYVAQIGANQVLYASTLLDNGTNTWSFPLLISDPTHDVVSFSIACDALGTSTIIWGEAIAPLQEFVRAATLPLSGSPIFETDLTDRTLVNTIVDTSSRVAMDSFGNAIAIWGITMGGAPMVQIASKASGQNWTTSQTLSTTGETPLIVLSDQGTAVATWIDSISGVLMGSRDLFQFPLAAPSNFTGHLVKNKFLTQTAYFLNMTWAGSLAPHIVDYQIFQNGILIATVPATGPFEFTQPLQSKTAKGIYTLIAIASNGNQSLPIPIVLDKKK